MQINDGWFYLVYAEYYLIRFKVRDFPRRRLCAYR